MGSTTHEREPAFHFTAVLDVTAKIVLALLLVLVVLDPTWGNLEGKAPNTRAMTYPLLAFAVPAWRLLCPTDAAYPWLPDLLLTSAAFSDILGNRLDLYDRLFWFDDLAHLGLTLCVTAAMVLLTLERTVSAVVVLERSVALGMTAALVWEVFEYVSFVTQSAELPTAYADTIGDLGLGWIGTILAAGLVHTIWRHHLPEPGEEQSLTWDDPVVGDGARDGAPGPSAPMAETLGPACAVTSSED